MSKEETQNQPQPDEEKPLNEETLPETAEETQPAEESPADELTKWR